MTDLKAIIQGRRSIRRYQARAVPKAVLLELLEAGNWSPSAHNRQPWRFVVVETDEQREQLARQMGERLRHDLALDKVPEATIEADVARSYERLTSAPVLVVVCMSLVDMDVYPDERRNMYERTMAIQSVSMASQNMLLMAHALGLGACWLCAPLFVPETVVKALTLPQDWVPMGVIALGYPAQVREKTREPLETRVLWR